MDQRCTQHCGAACSCCHTRDNDQLHIRIVFTYLIHQTCHTVNTGIPTADHGNGFSFFCLIKSKYTAVYLFFHRCGHELFTCKILLYKIHIYGVTDDHITFI